MQDDFRLKDGLRSYEAALSVVLSLEALLIFENREPKPGCITLNKPYEARQSTSSPPSSKLNHREYNDQSPRYEGPKLGYGNLLTI